ncbi:MAG: rhodanese-like domain-containing protein [Methylococcales bacterium]|nr:rhodanese-like domain-containing protein [Methylococcales bacterium]
MKKPSKLLLLLILAASAAFGTVAESAQKPNAPIAAKQAYIPKSPQIHRAELDALLAKPDELLVIDLRRPDEVGSIGGFPVYLNIQADQLEKSLDYIPKERTIVTVSNHAGRSGKAADLLADKGFKVAGFVGAQYYEQEGGKLIKIAKSKSRATENHKH